MAHEFERGVKFFRCLRCKHEWIPTGDRPPKVCPKCKSPYWNKPRVRK